MRKSVQLLLAPTVGRINDLLLSPSTSILHGQRSTSKGFPRCRYCGEKITVFRPNYDHDLCQMWIVSLTWTRYFLSYASKFVIKLSAQYSAQYIYKLRDIITEMQDETLIVAIEGLSTGFASGRYDTVYAFDTSPI